MSESKSAVSFSFSSNRKNDRNVKLGEPKSFELHKESQDEKDYVKTLEGNKIRGTKKVEEKKELIIPLITKNRWRVPAAKKDEPQSKQTELTDLDSEAAKEILEETHRANENWENRGTDGVPTNLEIPLFMQNRVPSGYETDEKVDVSLRAEESNITDYEAVPVEAYGMAMLRGMGWKPSEGIGLTRKGVAPVLEPKIRPKGLGLGANPAALKQATGSSDKKKEGEEDLKLIINAYVQVVDGRQQGMYGQIISMDGNTGRALVKMAVGSNEVEVNELLLKPVSAKEYKDSARVLNKDKYDKYKSKQERERQEEEERKEKESKEKKKKRRSRSRSRSRERNRDRSRSRERERSRSRSKERKSKSEKESRSKKHSKDHNDERSTSWIHPHLRVRCIDSRFKEGQYYKQKMIVIDVVSKKHCTCKTETGKFLDNVSISKLETVIPRGHPSVVMVVSGKKRGQICEVIERDKERCMAIVQTLPDRDEVFQISYDDICEYTGDVRNM